MIKFPKIGQFRQAVKNVSSKVSYKGVDSEGNPLFNDGEKKPTLKYTGTVKLHGTNASVVIKSDKEIEAQSRNRVIRLEEDSYGFAKFVSDIGTDVWKNLSSNLLRRTGHKSQGSNDSVVIYGEWVGNGIQNGVGIVNLDRMFVIFHMIVVHEDELQSQVDLGKCGALGLDSDRIFNIYDPRFPVFKLDIDFENPGLSQNKLIEITNSIEKECPVAKQFGVSGLGEGAVWSCKEDGFTSSEFWFKVKGAKHSVSKVTKLASVDVEKINSINEFVKLTLTENRLIQGIEHLKENGLELTRNSTGDFIRWIYNDIVSEESDTMLENNMDKKDVGKHISTPARRWFFNHLE